MIAPASIPATPEVPREGRDRSLWLAVLGAPFLFLCHLQLNYMLVLWACTSGKRWVLPLVSALFLALTAAGGVVAWHELRDAQGTDTEPHVTTPLGRHRYLAALGVMTSALFFLGILAQALATFIIDPCPE